MKNQFGFLTLTACALSMGTLLGCGIEEPGAATDEPIESVTAAYGPGQACTPDPTGVSASSVNGTNVANNAIDRNTQTRWESKQGVDPQWLQIDLGSAMPMTGVTLNWENACGKDYTIQTSDDGKAWATVFTVTGNTTAGVKTHNFTKTARFVRMNGTKRCTQYGYSLWEFQANTTTRYCNLDRDGDGYGAGYLFCGSCPANTVSTFTDCNDGNTTAKPGQTAYFSSKMTYTDGSSPSWDWNCDGNINWQTSSGWSESDGVFSVCVDSTGKKTGDCSKCVYQFVGVDASDCGQHRCSLGIGDVNILCH
jgi:hypothetical protein